MAGVALGDIDRHFAWQAWHLWHWAGSGGALGSQMNAAAFCVAGVAFGDVDAHPTWQAWPLVTSTAWQAWRCWHWAGSGGALVPRSRRGRRGFLCGRRGTQRHGRAVHPAWQAWDLVTSTVRVWH